MLIVGACLWPLAGSAQAAAPSNLTLPAIQGTPQVGQTLSYVAGTWDQPVKVTDRWWACPSPSTCAQIPGTRANQPTYKLKPADLGDTIMIVEAATSQSVPPVSTTVDSVPVGPVTPLPPPPVVPPVNTAPPVISGTPQQGQTISVNSPGTWTNSPTAYSYVWQDCSSACVQSSTSSDSSLYTVTAADIGSRIRVQVTAENAAGPGAPADSNQTGAATPPAPVNAGAPTITGTPQEGRTLTENPGYWSNSPTSTSIQWLRCDAGDSHCSEIPGATATTYSLSPADIGATIQVTETATNAGGSTTAYSGFTSVVTNVAGTLTAPSTTSLLALPGDPVADQAVSLVATITSATGSARPAGSVTFAASGAPLPGCMGLAVDPIGQSVTVTCQTAFPASTAAVTAAFAPGPGTLVTGSASSSTTVMIGRAPSSLSLDAPTRPDLGSKTTYTATIGSPAGSGGPVQPSGTVTFLDAGKPVAGCRHQPVVNQNARCTLTYQGLGKHHIAVSYGGDANFSGSSSSAKTVTVSPIPPTGYVTAYLNWSFYYTPGYTQVRGLIVSELAWGTSISVTCGGHACPFAHHTTLLTIPRRCAKNPKKKCARPKPVNLIPIFHRRHLTAGTQLTVSIAHRAWLGKYYRFTTRSGHKPRIFEACLAVNITRPGIGCT